MPRGFFITFEGGEGVGKTTQIAKLNSALTGKGLKTTISREPGGTPEAEEIRKLLSHPQFGKNWTHHAELLLISAGRDMHVRNLIRPALDDGDILICDRFTDSTRVYQGYVQKLDPTFIDLTIQHTTGGLEPDLTFILDLPAEEGLKRVRQRGIRDHYDEQDHAFYSKIRDGFLMMSRQYSDRCVVVDANRSLDVIASEILSITLERLHNA